MIRIIYLYMRMLMNVTINSSYDLPINVIAINYV